MQKQFVDGQEYNKIIENQNSIIGVLDDGGKQLTSLLEISQKYIIESKINFQRGIEAIKKIRMNLDETHKALREIQKISNLNVVIDQQ